MNTDEEILYHSTIMFANLGFYGTSMGNIAKACNKNKATIYHYFKSKELLYEKIVADVLTGFNTLLEQKIQSKRTSAEKVRAYIETIVDLDIVTARILYRLIVDDIGSLPLPIVSLVTKRVKIFEALFKEGIARGEFKMMDPKGLYQILVGSTFGYLLENSANGSSPITKKTDDSKKKFVDELALILLDKILNEEDISL